MIAFLYALNFAASIHCLLLPFINFPDDLLDLLGYLALLRPVCLLLLLHLSNLVFLLVEHFRVAFVNILLTLVFSKLLLQRFLVVFALVFEIEDASVARSVHHLSLDGVDLFSQERNPLAFILDLAFILSSPTDLLLD